MGTAIAIHPTSRRGIVALVARTIEQTLAELREVRGDPAKSQDKLRAALRLDRAGSGIAIAAVAKLVAEHRLDVLAPELVAAFESLVDAKRDPGCRGKSAIARALHELDHWDDRVFVAGLSVVQQEGMKPYDDTAAELRGICGLAHAHFARHDALDVLARLLADRERIVREAAAQGIADTGRPDGTALLRFKLLVGDAEPEVLAACFAALFQLARDASIEFALGVLAAHDDRAEAAVLALGGARASEVVERLIGWCDDARPEQRHRVGYLALALLRCDPANAHLLDAIRTRSRGDALGAARALATFKDDASIAGQIREAARAGGDKTIRAEIDALLA